jgi:hypothetical protein
MDETRTTEEQLARAQHATVLLTDPLLQESMQTAEAMFIAHWRDGKTTQLREEAYFKLKGLQQVVLALRAIISDGAFAQKLLDDGVKKAQREQSIVRHKE